MRLTCRRSLRQFCNFIRNKKSYNLRCFSITCILACLLVYTIVYVILFDRTVIDTQYVNAVDESVLNNRVDFHEVSIVRSCSNLTRRCYSVRDRKMLSDNGEEIVERHLLVDGFTDDSDTVVRLIPPNGETFDTSDTRIWVVDHSTIRSDYVAAMLVAPFLMTSLSLDSKDSGKHVLGIGLGGGSFDMALHKMKREVNITIVELDPVVVDIAQSWFGVMESKNHHVIVDDGLKFVEKASKSGAKFDVIVLDACDEAIKSPCPPATFRNKNVIEMMKGVLTPTGSLLVNILSEDGDGVPSSVLEIVSLFASVFPACVQMKMVREVNVILACVPYSISNIRQQLNFYNSRLATIAEKFKFAKLLEGVSLV
uniref:PABS domain-containing protein n=1 Tax=Haemonchus contortus TaxID=6289 RepID=A0A7I4YV57_HAECO